MRTKIPIELLAILLIAACGFALIITASRYGIGTSPDSVIYIGAARSLLSGAGLTVPIGNPPGAPLTQYPPFYPLILAVIGLPGIDPLTTAKFLAALSFACNIFLVGYILRKLQPGHTWAAIVGALLVLLAPVMTGVHIMAWTEPLFILLGLSGLFVLGTFLEKASTRYLIGAGLLTGFAALTRYAGLSIIAAGCLGLIFFTRQKLSHRVRDSAVFALLSCLPIVVVMGFNWLSVGTATNREIAFHPPVRSQLWQGLTTITGWLGVPAEMPTILHVVLILVVCAGILALLYRSLRHPEHQATPLTLETFPGAIWLILLWIPIYVIFLLISITFLDANTPLDDRILSPLYPAIIVLVMYSISRVMSVSQRPWIWKGATLGIATLLLIQASLNSIPVYKSAYSSGIGFSSPIWHQSQLVNAIRTLPSELLVYSNAPDAVYLNTGRPSARLPRLFEQSTAQINVQFDRELADLGQEIMAGRAVIVYFDQQGRQTNPSQADLLEHLPLLISHQADDGRIYILAEP